MAVEPSEQRAIKPREQQIIDLWEAGLSIEKIAPQLGLSVAYVRQTVMLLCTGNGPQKKYATQMKRASEILLGRILAMRTVS